MKWIKASLENPSHDWLRLFCHVRKNSGNIQNQIMTWKNNKWILEYDDKEVIDWIDESASDKDKEIEHLKLMKHAELEDKYEGRIETLEEELATCKLLWKADMNYELEEQYAAAKQEIERLKGLIEKVWWMDHENQFKISYSEKTAKGQWDYFKTENNL